MLLRLVCFAAIQTSTHASYAACFSAADGIDASCGQEVNASSAAACRDACGARGPDCAGAVYNGGCRLCSSPETLLKTTSQDPDAILYKRTGDCNVTEHSVCFERTNDTDMGGQNAFSKIVGSVEECAQTCVHWPGCSAAVMDLGSFECFIKSAGNTRYPNVSRVLLFPIDCPITTTSTSTSAAVSSTKSAVSTTPPAVTTVAPTTTVTPCVGNVTRPTNATCWTQCDSVVIGDVCYALHYERKTNFEDGKRNCEEGGGYLASTTDGGTSLQLLEHLIKDKDAWVNLVQDANATNLTEAWYWYHADGSRTPELSTVGSGVWWPGKADGTGTAPQPNGADDRHAVLYADSFVYDRSGTSAADSLCAFPKTPVETVRRQGCLKYTTPTVESCLEHCDRVVIGGYCYSIHPTSANYTDSKALCGGGGGFLASVASQEQYDELAHLLVMLNINMRVRVNLLQKAGETQTSTGWQWHLPNGSQLDLWDPAPWFVGEPSDNSPSVTGEGGVEQSGYIDTAEDGLLGDAPGELAELGPPLCMFPLQNSSTTSTTETHTTTVTPTTVTVNESSPPNCYERLDDQSIGADSLEVLDAVTAENCTALCEERIVCVAGVYNAVKRKCHIKSTTETQNHTGFTTYVKQPCGATTSTDGATTPAEMTITKTSVLETATTATITAGIFNCAYERLNRTALMNSTLANVQIDGLEDCLAHCDAREDCAAVSYHADDLTCHLKRDTTKPQISNVWTSFVKTPRDCGANTTTAHGDAPTTASQHLASSTSACVRDTVDPTAANCEDRCSHQIIEGRCFGSTFTTYTYAEARDVCDAGGGQLGAAPTTESYQDLIDWGVIGFLALQLDVSDPSTAFWQWYLPNGSRVALSSSVAWTTATAPTDPAKPHASLFGQGDLKLHAFAASESHKAICMFPTISPTTTTKIPTTSKNTAATNTTKADTTTTLSSAANTASVDSCCRAVNGSFWFGTHVAANINVLTLAECCEACASIEGCSVANFHSDLLTCQLKSVSTAGSLLVSPETHPKWTTIFTDCVKTTTTGLATTSTAAKSSSSTGSLTSSQVGTTTALSEAVVESTRGCSYAHLPAQSVVGYDDLDFFAPSVQACLAICDGRPDCPGVVVKPSDERCFVKKLTALEPLVNTNDYDAYRKQDSACKEAVLSTASGCRYVQHNGLDVMSQNDLTHELGEMRAEECAALCDAEAACVGAVHSPVGGAGSLEGCFLKSALDGLAPATAPSITLLLRQNGSCVGPRLSAEFCGYKRLPGRPISGSDVLNFTTSSIAACLAVCDGRPGCPGVVVLLDDERCYIKERETFAPLVNAPAFDGYERLVRACQADPVHSHFACDYSRHARLQVDGHDMGSEPVSDASACASLCDASEGCVAAVHAPVQLGATTAQCALKSSLDGLVPSGQPGTEVLVRLRRNCTAFETTTRKEELTTTAMGATTTATTATATTTVKLVTTTRQEEPTTRLTSATTTNAIEMSTSTAVASTTMTLEEFISTANCTYTKHPRMRLPDQNDIIVKNSTVEACLALCDGRPTCGGVDFQRENRDCYVADTTDVAGTEPWNSTDFYKRESLACQGEAVISANGCGYRVIGAFDSYGLHTVGTDAIGTSYEDCATHCDSVAGCVGAARTEDGRCFGKSSLDGLAPWPHSQTLTYLERVDGPCNSESTTILPALTTGAESASTEEKTTMVASSTEGIKKTTTGAEETTANDQLAESIGLTTTSVRPSQLATTVDPSEVLSTEGCSYTRHADRDFAGADDLSLETGSLAACLALCDGRPGCPGVVFQHSTKGCFVKTASASLSPLFDNVGVDTFVRRNGGCAAQTERSPGGACYRLYGGLDTPGANDIGGSNASSIAACLALCDARADCVAAAFYPTWQHCAPKSSMDGLAELAQPEQGQVYLERGAEGCESISTTGSGLTTSAKLTTTRPVEKTTTEIDEVVKSEPQTRNKQLSTKITTSVSQLSTAERVLEVTSTLEASSTSSRSTEATSSTGTVSSTPTSSAQATTTATETSPEVTSTTLPETSKQTQTTSQSTENSSTTPKDSSTTGAAKTDASLETTTEAWPCRDPDAVTEENSSLPLCTTTQQRTTTAKAETTTKVETTKTTTKHQAHNAETTTVADAKADAEATAESAEATTPAPSTDAEERHQSTSDVGETDAATTEVTTKATKDQHVTPPSSTSADSENDADRLSTTQSPSSIETATASYDQSDLSTTDGMSSTTKEGEEEETTTLQATTSTLPESTVPPKTTKAPSTTTAFPFQQCRTSLNVRHSGGGVLSNSIGTTEECCKKCQLEKECQGFTYDLANRTCYLLRGVGRRSLERGWLSGGTPESPIFDQKENGRDSSGKCLTQQYMTSYYGGDMGKHKNVSQGDCCDLCFENANCVGYSFERTDNVTNVGHCTLKKPTRQKNPIYEEKFISATLTAQRNLTTTQGPSTSEEPSTEPPVTQPPRPRDAPPEPQPPILGETEQVVVDTIQSIGCIFIVVAAAATLGVCALFRNTSHERLIHVSQELSILLAHLIILAHRDPKYSDYNWTICRLSAMALHYLQTVTTAAFLLEAVQIYAVSTSVELAGGFFTRRASFVLAWALPAVLTEYKFSGITAPFIYYDYVSWFSCWINLDTVGSKVVFGPIIANVAVTVIVWEAASSFRGQVLSTDPAQQLTALVNRQGLPVVMGLYIACHATGSMAIHYQRVSIYGLVFVLNAVFGCSLFFFHALSDQRIRAAFAKILPCLKSK